MKISDLFEGGSGSGRPDEGQKKRPDKTLWFNSKELWGHDIKIRYPDAELVVDKDEDKYVAVDIERKMSYGVWNGSKNDGMSYSKPRPLATSVAPKRQGFLQTFKPPKAKLDTLEKKV